MRRNKLTAAYIKDAADGPSTDALALPDKPTPEERAKPTSRRAMSERIIDRSFWNADYSDPRWENVAIISRQIKRHRRERAEDDAANNEDESLSPTVDFDGLVQELTQMMKNADEIHRLRAEHADRRQLDK